VCEATVWPRLQRPLSAEQADELGHKLEPGKNTAPARPHPRTPPSPGPLKAAALRSRAADPLRDAITGRDE